MTLRVVGAGLGRTGTSSLKQALEQLLGAPCYHMREVMARPDHVRRWHAIADGAAPGWNDLFAGFGAAVDWPVASFWPELADAYPEALVLLSVRDGRSWWESAANTIFLYRRMLDDARSGMIDALFARHFDVPLDDADACIAAMEAHNRRVREGVPAERLLEWRTEDGWEPICQRLGLPVPAEPFPHRNSREELRAQMGLDA